MWRRLSDYFRGLVREAVVAKISVPVEKRAVRHGPASADIADFIPLDWVHCHNAEGQTLIPLQGFDLFRNPIPDEVEYLCLGKIFGERPRILLTGKVSSAAIPQNHVNSVSLAHDLNVT
jgi:hypothetical protein